MEPLGDCVLCVTILDSSSRMYLCEGGLVQDNDGGVLQHGPGNGNALLLTTGGSWLEYRGGPQMTAVLLNFSVRWNKKSQMVVDRNDKIGAIMTMVLLWVNASMAACSSASFSGSTLAVADKIGYIG